MSQTKSEPKKRVIVSNKTIDASKKYPCDVFYVENAEHLLNSIDQLNSAYDEVYYLSSSAKNGPTVVKKLIAAKKIRGYYI